MGVVGREGLKKKKTAENKIYNRTMVIRIVYIDFNKYHATPSTYII